MNDTPRPTDDLGRALHQADPSALLVPPRILRRAIKKSRDLGGLGLRVPHPRLCLVCGDALGRIATADELELPPGARPPEQAVLLPRPHPSRLRKVGTAAALRDCWRGLFHAHVHRAIRRAGQSDVAARVARLGRVVFEEAREVLRQENLLFDPDDDAEVYEEFVCVWLDAKHFDPSRLGDYFPAALDRAAVDAVFAGDVDAAALLAATRPPGSADALAAPPRPETPPPPDEAQDDSGPKTLAMRADARAAGGNLVRALLLRQRALDRATATARGPLRVALGQEMALLAARLERALRFGESQREDWARCLSALLPSAARGSWNVEARLLYDLQKTCIDNEKEIFAVDLVEWFVTWFRRPIKRLLPDQPLVLTVKNLRHALAKLPKARMPDAERDRLRELVQESLTRAELELRSRLQPRLVAALDAVGLVPRNAAERLSRDRLVEELLDLVVRRCYLTMSDLRDALARSRVKLPDLVDPIEFFTGDPLIRLDRRLARDLDGVYRRGEVYLRWLQRLSSLFFGNPLGRALSLYVLLPLLGGFFVVAGVNILFEELHKFLHVPELNLGNLGPAVGLEKDPKIGSTPNLIWYAVAAAFLVPMLHWPAFRAVVFRGAYLVWLGLRAVSYDAPAGFLRLKAVRAVVQSRPYLLFWAFVAKPALFVLPLTALLVYLGVEWEWVAGWSAAALVVVSVVVNTRLGLVTQEAATDWGVRWAQLFREDVLPGLFRAVAYFFRWLVERVDRGIYAVDEWLRFRGGQGRLAFFGKMALGLLWFLATYVLRFAVNLLIEPQINPIKHFPVVTVSHKLSLLLVEPVASATGLSKGVVLGLLGLVPGFYGFLVWELKENWKLYRANESPTVDAEMVGGHGEHVVHLMRPGFHSGTLPKLYAKKRRAKGASYRKAEAEAHHVEEAVRHFLERELVAVLTASRRWGTVATVAVGDVHLATNRIRAELCCAALGGEGVLLDFESSDGGLTAAVARPGWLAGLGEAHRAAFADALAGLFKKAGADRVAVGGAVEDFGRPLAWADWVAVWQRDERGEAGAAAVPGVRLVP